MYNQLFRLCKYEPGGHFAPHFDSHYVQQADDTSHIRSFKTFMMYLNSSFTGGTTNFVDESQTLHKVSVYFCSLNIVLFFAIIQSYKDNPY